MSPDHSRSDPPDNSIKPIARLLVVDPSSDNVEIFETRLRFRGYEVFTGSTGKDALALWPQVDLILMDATLPDVDGFEVCREIKKLDPLKQIILVTARDTMQDKVAGLQSGADDYLFKPINFPELEAMIQARLRLVVQVNALREGYKGNASIGGHTFTASFSFPEEVRTSCEQYLLYFGEFLRDVGIRATTDITHEAGEVLFAVTPEEPQTALAKIRRALEVYLRFPDDAGIVVALERAADPRAFQLLANIQTLQLQVNYARAMIEAKDETIAALQGRLSDRIWARPATELLQQAPSLKAPPSSDEVQLLGGAVSLVPWEGKGVKVNTPQIFRWLRAFVDGQDQE